MKFRTGEYSGYYMMIFGIIGYFLFFIFFLYQGLFVPENQDDKLFIVSCSILFFFSGICCIRIAYTMRFWGRGKLCIDEHGVTGIYKKSIIFQSKWEDIKDIGIIVINRQRVGTSFIYFSKNELNLSPKFIRKFLKWLRKAPFSDDFIYCSVSWPQRIPDILSFIPEENEVHYLNGRFVKNGKKLRYSRY